MKKTTMALALAMALAMPTVTSYAETFNGLPDRKPAQYVAVDPNTVPGGAQNPWIALEVGSQVINYPGRVQGTWQKRADGYYYVKADGTDLKNGYVDGLYLSWTGRMIPELDTNFNWIMYNAVYGGQMPITPFVQYGYVGGGFTHFFSRNFAAVTLDEYRKGGYAEINYTKAAFDWMDGEMPRLLQLSEQDRAKEIAKLVAGKLQYTAGQTYSATAFNTGVGGSKAFAYMYEAFAQRAGLTVSTTDVGQSVYGTDINWNVVKINGTDYLVDTVAYKTTGNAAYLSSTTLWAGYVSRETLYAIDAERGRKEQEAADKYNAEHPEGIPVNGVTNGGAF